MEIQDNLFPNQTTPNYPNLTYRIFNLKNKELYKNLKKYKILNIYKSYISNIEYQKYRLPYSYNLLNIIKHYNTLYKVD